MRRAVHLAPLLLAALATGCRPHAKDAAGVADASALEGAAEAPRPLVGGAVVLADGIQGRGIVDIATDGAWVYFLTQEGLFEVPAAGGGVQPVHLDAGRHAGAIVVDGGALYLVDHGTAAGDDRILRVAAHGAPATAVATGLSVPGRLQTSDGWLVWSRPAAHPARGAIVRLREGGGSPETVVDDLEDPGACGASAGAVCWADAPQPRPTDAGADERASIRCRRLAGGPITVVAKSEAAPSFVGIAGSDVLWIGRAGFDHGAPHDVPYDGIRRAPVAGGPSALFVGHVGSANLLLVGDDVLYFPLLGPGGPVRRPLDGGPPRPLTTTDPSPGRWLNLLATDGRSVYVGEYGTVVRTEL